MEAKVKGLETVKDDLVKKQSEAKKAKKAEAEAAVVDALELSKVCGWGVY